MLVTFPVI
ncbi:hypothetical protein YPPY64_0939, partial [Yersinia pestis PY-64]